jgi:hypothetical protein
VGCLPLVYTICESIFGNGRSSGNIEGGHGEGLGGMVLCHGRDVHPTWVTFTMTGTLRSLDCGSV